MSWASTSRVAYLFTQFIEFFCIFYLIEHLHNLLNCVWQEALTSWEVESSLFVWSEVDFEAILVAIEFPLILGSECQNSLKLFDCLYKYLYWLLSAYSSNCLIYSAVNCSCCYINYFNFIEVLLVLSYIPINFRIIFNRNQMASSNLEGLMNVEVEIT